VPGDRGLKTKTGSKQQEDRERAKADRHGADKEKGTGKMTAKLRKHMSSDQLKVYRLTETFKQKSGVIMTDEEVKQREAEQDAKRSFMKKLRNANTGKLEHGDLKMVDYVEELSTSHGSNVGMLVLIWTSGSIDFINLETRECVQILEDQDLRDCHPTSVTFFPQKDFPKEKPAVTRSTSMASMQSVSTVKSSDSKPSVTVSQEMAGKSQLKKPVRKISRLSSLLSRTGSVSESMNPHFAVVGNSNGMIKVWTPTTVLPPGVQYKFKCISLNPNQDAGAIVGIARVEQYDSSSCTTLLALLTASAKGAICLFRGYTWEPLKVCQAPNIPGGSFAEHDLNMMAMYDERMALISFNDGDLHVWRIELSVLDEETAARSRVLKQSSGSKPKQKKSKNEPADVAVHGDLWKLWPPSDQEESIHHFGQGTIVDMMPSENRFTSKSRSTGLLEWFVDDFSSQDQNDTAALRKSSGQKLAADGEVDMDCRDSVHEVGAQGNKAATVTLLYGDQFSRTCDLKDRLRGVGELKAGASASCYVKSTNAVLVAIDQEIIAQRILPAPDLKSTLEDLHRSMPRYAKSMKDIDDEGHDKVGPVQAFKKQVTSAQFFSSSSGDDEDDEDGIEGQKPILSAERIKMKVERQAERHAARKERKRLQDEERMRIKVEAEEVRRQAVMKEFVENMVEDRSSAIQSLRNLDVLPTPFTLHFSRGNDDKIVDMLEDTLDEVEDESSSACSSGAESEESAGNQSVFFVVVCADLGQNETP